MSIHDLLIKQGKSFFAKHCPYPCQGGSLLFLGTRELDYLASWIGVLQRIIYGVCVLIPELRLHKIMEEHRFCLLWIRFVLYFSHNLIRVGRSEASLCA